MSQRKALKERKPKKIGPSQQEAANAASCMNSNAIEPLPNMDLLYIGDEQSSPVVGQLDFPSQAMYQISKLNASSESCETCDENGLDRLYRAIRDDRQGFKEQFVTKSMFFMNENSFFSTFRLVSKSCGLAESSGYPGRFTTYLKQFQKSNRYGKRELFETFRHKSCLDLVAVKFEILKQEDFRSKSAAKINLIREFLLLHYLFKNKDESFPLIGFPLPIMFHFVGKDFVKRDLKSVFVSDFYGRKRNYFDTFMMHAENRIQPESVTTISYMATELLGPSLREIKEYYSPQKRKYGRMYFSVQTALKLMDQVLCRLMVLHRSNIVYLDLKPANICMGTGKTMNTVYLNDFSLSRFCSDIPPEVMVGSQRYMSLNSHDMQPCNYIMDIESWFYLLTVLLIDYLPWSEDPTRPTDIASGVDSSESSSFDSCDNSDRDKQSEQSQVAIGIIDEKHQVSMRVISERKRRFWGDEGHFDKQLVIDVLKRIKQCHESEVPDIAIIFTDIYKHVSTMRRSFLQRQTTRMNNDIRHEESDLCKAYHKLRKLLLYPYDCDFQSEHSCFIADKDLTQRQLRREKMYAPLIFISNDRDWKWDWDQWFNETSFKNRDKSRMSKN